MAFLANSQTQELVRFAYYADTEARSDLALGYISTENDYTSTFTSALRRNINAYSDTGLTATSLLLPPHVEREIGGDAAIIISRNNENKVAVFEAKWPRFSNSSGSWDYEQTSSWLSHFSDQLDRQRKWADMFAVFEMFYCEFPINQQPFYLDSFGSTCVWHEDAQRFRANRGAPNDVWTKQELADLLRQNGVGLPNTLTAFGECRRGQIIRQIAPRDISTEFRLPQTVLSITAPTLDDERRLPDR